jgi:DNA-binding HxlR family transcriptional regulator
VLTQKGLELCDVLLSITAWGDRWTAARPDRPFYCGTGIAVS